MARQEQWDALGAMWGINSQAQNRFNNYQDMFDYSTMAGLLDEVYSGQEEQINTQTAEDIASQQGGAAARMASRGITGGSAVDDTLSGISADINKQKYNALGELGSSKAQAKAGLMDTFNQRKLQTTKMATDVDLQNILNEISKATTAGNMTNTMANYDLQKENQPGVMEDIFSGLGLATQALSIPTGKNSNVLSSLLKLL